MGDIRLERATRIVEEIGPSRARREGQQRRHRDEKSDVEAPSSFDHHMPLRSNSFGPAVRDVTSTLFAAAKGAKRSSSGSHTTSQNPAYSIAATTASVIVKLLMLRQMVAHEPVRAAIACRHHRNEWRHAPDIGRGEELGQLFARPADLEQELRSIRPGHAISPNKSGFDIGDMSQCAAHCHEIRRAIGDRQRLRGFLHRGYAELLPGDGEHRLAEIDPDDLVAFAGERERLAQQYQPPVPRENQRLIGS
jgi:hypothetical protein